MAREFKPHPYQSRAIDMAERMKAFYIPHPMGAGKTVTALTIIDRAIHHEFTAHRALVVAPLKTVETGWNASDWGHLNGLGVTKVLGSEKNRLEALESGLPVHVINRDNLIWLINHFGKQWPFDLVVIDENWGIRDQSKTWKALKKVRSKIDRLVIMCGTPRPKGVEDLWAQFYLIDPAILRPTISEFRAIYMQPDKRNAHQIFSWKPKPFAEDQINQVIAPYMAAMHPDEYPWKPDPEPIEVRVRIPRKEYETLEKDLVLGEVEAQTAAVLCNKLRQVASGRVYDSDGGVVRVHDEKFDALSELLEAADGPVLVFYEYEHTKNELVRRFQASTSLDIEAWNRGVIPLLCLHPACLAGDTQVFVEQRGWVTITDVTADDRVFDGVEFVRHGGCSYSGYRDVIDVFGIRMTPDHKLLIGGAWKEAKDVRDSAKLRAEAVRLRQKVEQHGFGEVSPVRWPVGDGSAECYEEQSRGEKALFKVLQPCSAWPVEFQFLQSLAWNPVSLQRSKRPQLWGTRDSCLRKMGGLFQLLRRHVFDFFGRHDDRQDRCKQVVLQGELPLGVPVRAAKQQAKQQGCRIPRGVDTSCGALPPNGPIEDRLVSSAEPRTISRGGSERCGKHEVQKANELSRAGSSSCRDMPGVRGWEDGDCDPDEARDDPRGGCGERQGVSEIRSVQTKKEHVFDLINCGPRNRFVIRNNEGEAFISHNSAGHGVDGLQHGGSIVVWVDLPWDLGMWQQANARLDRQGQTRAVRIYTIVAENTVDEDVVRALDRKAVGQDEMLRAIRERRK